MWLGERRAQYISVANCKQVHETRPRRRNVRVRGIASWGVRYDRISSGLTRSFPRTERESLVRSSTENGRSFCTACWRILCTHLFGHKRSTSVSKKMNIALHSRGVKRKLKNARTSLQRCPLLISFRMSVAKNPWIPSSSSPFCSSPDEKYWIVVCVCAEPFCSAPRRDIYTSHLRGNDGVR